jgi:hypothetical protein
MMTTQNPSLFEAPLAHEAAHYTNPHTNLEYYSYPELANEFEEEMREGTHYSSVLGEEEWGAIGEFEALTRPKPSTLSGLPGFSLAEEKALRITSSFETGRPLGFGGLTGDFDGMGLSFGLMQWNFGSGSLQPLLLEFAQRHLQHFNKIFGSDASRFLQILHQSRKVQMRFVRSINDKRKRIVALWASRFGQLANDPLFRSIQLRHIRRGMNAAVNHAKRFGLRSERGLALMFDTVTQNGAAWPKVRNRAALIKQRSAAFRQRMGRPPTEREFLEIIANVIADTVNPRWSEDVRRRRMTIVRGRGRVHGQNRDLGREFGLTDQPF